jgi:hypothetical protein
VKLATEPSRIESLTAYFRTRVLPANTLNGELTPGSSRDLRGIASDWPKGHRGYVSTLQVLDLDDAVRLPALEEPRSLDGVVLSVAVGARRAVYSNFELSACHCD